MENPNQTSARVEQAQERDTLLRHNRERETVDRVFDQHATKFKIGNDDVIKLLGGVVNFDADQNPVVNGIALTAMLENVAKVNPHLVAGTWQEHHTPESQIKSKADLKTTKDKVLFLEKFGDMAYARLPQTAPETREIPVTELNWEQYQELPLRERAKIAGEQGATFIAGLKRKSSEQSRYQRLVGTPHGR